MEKIKIRVIYENRRVIMEYNDSELFQACKEFDRDGTNWEFV